MIVSCLRGGFGNQINEYAFARYLAFLTGQEVGLNTWIYSPSNPRRIIRSYELGEYSFSAARYSTENWNERDPIEVNGELLEYISEDDISVPDLIEKAKRQPDMSCALLGFWQSDVSYLDDPAFWQTLLQDFTPKTPIGPDDVDACLRPIFESESSVGVHVRRTDYLKHTDRFHTLESDYYAAALDGIRQTVEAPEVFVFSDDVEQVRSENLFDFPVTYVETGSLHMDFNLLRSCRHNIIANSTFSWWAAYLNANPDKQIVAPKNYHSIEDRQAAYDLNPRALTGWHLV